MFEQTNTEELCLTCGEPMEVLIDDNGKIRTYFCENENCESCSI